MLWSKPIFVIGIACHFVLHRPFDEFFCFLAWMLMSRPTLNWRSAAFLYLFWHKICWEGRLAIVVVLRLATHQLFLSLPITSAIVVVSISLQLSWYICFTWLYEGAIFSTKLDFDQRFFCIGIKLIVGSLDKEVELVFQYTFVNFLCSIF